MYKQLILLLFLFTSCVSSFGQKHQITTEQHIEVSLRKIGHQILLASGDYTSRVLPIKKIENRYKIAFESEFEFKPETLVGIVNRIFNENKLSKSYLLEVEKCNTSEIVYSYEQWATVLQQDIQCATRKQPKDCYALFITFIDSSEINLKEQKSSFSSYKIFMIVLLVILIGGFIYLKMNKSKPPTTDNSHLINIGAYNFDKRNMTLTLKSRTIELTSKEADLLYLLFSSANKVVERELILQTVWGDEGDYVGRTLDVFISKLRKKLSADANLKIVNVRGVGYKFVVN